MGSKRLVHTVNPKSSARLVGSSAHFRNNSNLTSVRSIEELEGKPNRVRASKDGESQDRKRRGRAARGLHGREVVGV